MQYLLKVVKPAQALVSSFPVDLNALSATPKIAFFKEERK
jgi:hypothetical protein